MFNEYMELKGIIDTIETDFLKIIIRHLKSGKIKLNQAKEITKEFLSLLPFGSDENLRDKLKAFTDKYDNFKPIYISILKMEEGKKTNEILTKMRGLIKENKVDEALKLVNKI